MNQFTRLTPLDLPTLMNNLHRSSVGFDQMFDVLNHSSAVRQSSVNYPPYDIVKLNDLCYAIRIAVAGFKEEDLKISVEGKVLKVSGEMLGEELQGEYIHRGISTKSFERTFNLADHVVVKNAHYEDGILKIDLEIEVPEALKPRQIEIKAPKQLK